VKSVCEEGDACLKKTRISAGLVGLVVNRFPLSENIHPLTAWRVNAMLLVDLGRELAGLFCTATAALLQRQRSSNGSASFVVVCGENSVHCIALHVPSTPE
jgi:hypothetical protein